MRNSYLDQTPSENAEKVEGLTIDRLPWANRFGVKLFFGKSKRPLFYTFATEQAREKYIMETKEGVAKSLAYKKESKEKAKIQAQEMIAKLEVGSILVNSWGYDQTNVDAYQVVAKKGASVWLQPIQTEVVQETSYDSAKVRPVKDKFIDGREVIIKRVNAYGVNFEHGGCRVVSSPEETFHCSWGH